MGARCHTAAWLGLSTPRHPLPIDKAPICRASFGSPHNPMHLPLFPRRPLRIPAAFNCRSRSQPFFYTCRHESSSGKANLTATSLPPVETDDCGIPLKPTWSVHDLLSSYPKPTLSSETLARLHRLSALAPPEEGTPEHAKLTRELEDLIKLVEAVKLVDCSELKSGEKDQGEKHEGKDIPDGRILPKGIGINLRGDRVVEEVKDGRELLKHAVRTQGGFYVVDVDRRLPG